MVHRLEQTMTDQKNRDVLKVLTLRKNRPVTLALLGIESQAHVHNAMPVRCCLYDALNYSSQLEEIRKDHKEKKDLRTTEELLSGFTRNDRLTPVITLCICFDAKEWDAPRTLHEMFRKTDPRILEHVDDYRLNLITPFGIKDFSRFSTELGLLMEFIQCSDNKEKIRATMESDERYQSVDISTVDMINAYTSANIPTSGAEGGKVNMCEGIKGLIEEGHAAGIREGHAAGIQDGEDQLTRLFRSLVPGSEDYNKALNATPAERKELYKKYGIID